MFLFLYYSEILIHPYFFPFNAKLQHYFNKTINQNSREAALMENCRFFNVFVFNNSEYNLYFSTFQWVKDVTLMYILNNEKQNYSFCTVFIRWKVWTLLVCTLQSQKCEIIFIIFRDQYNFLSKVPLCNSFSHFYSYFYPPFLNLSVKNWRVSFIVFVCTPIPQTYSSIHY